MALTSFPVRGPDNVTRNAEAQGVGVNHRPTVVQGLARVGAVTSVSASATSVQLLADNISRTGFEIWNNSDRAMYVKCDSTSTTASPTSATRKLAPEETYINTMYSGIVTAIWDAGFAVGGAARVTQYTASS